MAEEITAVIVDDEPPAREIIAEYLQAHTRIRLVKQFGKPSQAVDYLKKHRVHLLFLDIKMPGMDGFELLEQLDEWPYVIFSTAYDKYAVRAFELNAVDYLLKPYDQQRFDEALNRALRRIEAEATTIDREQVDALKQQVDKQQWYADRIFVRVGKAIRPVKLIDINWIQADGDYSEIHTSDDSYLCSAGLGEMEEKLPPDQFIRVHRSYIINVDAIDKLESDGLSGFDITMTDGAELRASRSYAHKLRNHIV